MINDEAHVLDTLEMIGLEHKLDLIDNCYVEAALKSPVPRVPASSFSSWLIFQYSVSAAGTDDQLFSRSSSTTDYDIKVAKCYTINKDDVVHLFIQIRKSHPEVYTNKKWCICIGIAILIVGFFTAAGIYFGCRILFETLIQNYFSLV